MLRRYCIPGWSALLLCAPGLVALLACGKAPSPEPYLQQLKSMDDEVRTRAANKLLVDYGQEITPRLIEAAHSSYTQVRFEVAKLLGRLRDPRGVPVLIEALGDRSAAVARQAARSLSQLHAPAAVPALLANSDDASAGVRREVFMALGACMSDSVAAVLGDSVQQVSLRALRDPVPEVRIAALVSMRSLGYRAAAEEIIRMARDTSAQVRHVAVQALGQIAAGSAPRTPAALSPRMRNNIFEALTAALDDSVQGIRTKAVRALGGMGEQRAVAQLERLRQKGSEEDRRETRRALEKLRPAAAVTQR